MFRRTVFALIFLIIGAFATPVRQNSDAYTDVICTGNIKNLWLDVVVVVDKSLQMTNAQLWQVRNTITTVFGQVGQIGPVKYPQDPRSTCVGLVTYDESAVVNAEDDASKSFTDLYNVVQTSLVSVDTTNTTYLSTGLLAAEQTLKNGLHRTYRYNFNRVILVFAADYQGAGTANDAKPIADRLKQEGYVIITVSCTSDPTAQLAIGQIASDGFSFQDEMNTSKLASQLTNALILANCFCPSDTTQFKTSSAVYAQCIYGGLMTGGSYGYNHAREACQSDEKQGYLVNEFSQEKHDFTVAVIQAMFPLEKKSGYFLGLTRNSRNEFVWEQPYGQDRIPMLTTGWTNWAPGFPTANSTEIASQPLGGQATYQWAPEQDYVWLYACQVASRTTENYVNF